MKKSKVLIVDDEPDVVSALQFRLATAGYETLSAQNGAEALEVIREHEVDLVLADFMMPEVNGLELTRLIKSNPNWFDTKILLFSCNGEPEFRQRAISLGAIDYISKMEGAKAIAARVFEVLAPQMPNAGNGSRAADEKADLRPQLRALAQSLQDVLQLAQLEKDLPASTKFALDSAGRITQNILNLAGAVEQKQPQAEPSEPAGVASNEAQEQPQQQE